MTRAMIMHQITFRELWDLAMVLEPAAAAAAAGTSDPDAIAALEDNLRETERALADREVPTGTVEAIVLSAENLFDPETAVVSAGDIGDAVLRGLRAVDEVAYLRFASVYKEFTGASDFEREMAALEGEG